MTGTHTQGDDAKPDGALYVGEVMHVRLHPFRHRFAYRVFSMLINIDQLPALSQRLRLFSRNRFNLFSFHDKDHGPRDGSPLRPWLQAALDRAAKEGGGMTWPLGRVDLHCFPRILGYVFNPLSIYFCHDTDGRLRAILYDVRNTFGDKHGYLIPVDADRPADAPIRQSCTKGFHVSPFMAKEGEYRFRLRPPGQTLSILIRLFQNGQEMLVATQTGTRQPMTDARLLANWLRHPLMTVKVMAAIHWQALFLWRKGAPFFRRPEPPPEAVSIILPR